LASKNLALTHERRSIIQQFDIDTASTAGSLSSIKFVPIILAIFDYFRALFCTVGSQAPSDINEIPDNSVETHVPNDTDATPAPIPTDDWHPIDRILEHRRFKGK
jgi:hypothetical protein